MAPARSPLDVVLEMLDERERSAADVDARVERALDREYWRSVVGDAPAGCADETASAVAGGVEAPPDAAGEAKLARTLSEEGWIAVPSCAAPHVVDDALRVVEAVRAAGWPAVFALLFDALWRLRASDVLGRLIGSHLGADYAQLPYAWVFTVAPVPGAAGWQPHVDGDRGREVVTAWMPLTGATLDNGCIYVLPRSRVPGGIGARFLELQSASRAELVALLHGARAAPAQAGSALVWDSETIHWGSYAEAGATPRIAVGWLYAAARAADEDLLFDPAGAPPGWLARVGLCAQSILRYGRDEPALRSELRFAQRLVERVRALDPRAVLG